MFFYHHTRSEDMSESNFFKKVREKLGFSKVSQAEMAVLLGIPVRNIQNWEQSRRVYVGSTTVTLYNLLSFPSTLENLLTLACQKKYETQEEFFAVMRLIPKIVKDVDQQKEFLKLLNQNNQFMID